MWGGKPAIASPSNWIEPSAGGTRPMMLFRVVDLPAPLRPRSATTSPRLTLSETSARIWARP
jgi:hypothetical protein